MTLDAERNRRRRPRRWLTVSAIVGLLLVAGAWIGVKQVAQQRLTQRIADATGLKVDASHIRIGPRGVSARNVIIGDTTNPTLTADQLTIIASFSELMSREPTIESIRIDSPTLRLTANEQGELDWPFRGKGESSLPGQRVVLVDAKVDVEQPGRAPLVVEGIDLAIEQAHQRGFDFDGTIQSFFGSQWQVSGSADLTGEAQARLTTEKLELDSREVTALALVPTESNRLPLAVSGAVRFDLSMSASQQNRVLGSSMQLTDATLSFPTIDMQLTTTNVSLRIDNDGINLVELTANVGKGSLKGDGSLSFGDPVANGGFQMKLDGVDLASLRSALPLAADVDGVTTGEITGRARMDHAGSLQLDVQGLGTVSDARVGRIQMASVQAEFGIKNFTLSSSGEKRLPGELTLTELEVREIAIADVTNVIPVDTDNKSFTVGSVSGIGSLQVPLETASDIRTWSAIANLSTSDISALGFHVPSGEAAFTMAGGLLLLDELAAQLNDHASISGSIQWPLVSDRPAVIDLHGQVSAGQLITAFNTHTDVSDLNGHLLVAAKLQLPSNAIGAIEALSGSLSVSSRELSWKGMGADELTFNGRFSENTLWLEDAKLRLSDNGEVVAKGRIALSDDGVSNVDVRGTKLDIRAIVDFAGQINPNFEATLRTTRVADAVKRTLADMPVVASAKERLSFDGTVRSSREDLMNPIDWIVTTEFRTNIASLAGMQTEGVSGRIELRDRTLALSDVDVRLPNSGHIGLVGSIPLRSDRPDDSRVRVEWHLVPLAEFAKYMSREVDIGGTTSGEFVVTAPAGATPELQRLSGKGTTTIQAVEVSSRVRIEDAASEIALKGGRLSFSEIALAGRTNAVGHAAIDLFAPYAYDLSAKIDNEPITVPITGSTSENSKPTLTGRLSLHADANGDLAESRLRLRGDAELRQIRLDNKGISDVKVAFSNVDHRNDRLQLEGDLLGGTVRMIADLPNSAAPEKLIAIDVQDWSLDEITALANLSNLHVELTGRLSGRGTIASWDNPSSRNVEVRLSGARGKYADIPIDDLALEMQMRAKQSTLKLTGKVLEGELIVEGATTLGDDLPNAIPIGVHLRAARLERLGKVSARYAKLQPLSGLGDLDMEVTLVLPEFRIAGAGDVSVRDVQWNRRRVLPAGKSRISVDDRFVGFQNLSVSLARGTIRGSVDWPRSRRDAGEYDLSIRDVELSQLAGFLPHWMPRASGTIEARLTGRAGDHVTGRGDVRVNRLTMQGLEATAIQLPFTYSLHTNNLSGKMVLRRATGRVASGRISSDGTIEFGRRTTIDLHANISKIDVGRLSTSVLGRGRYGLGRLSGTLDLTGSGIRSVRDLDGRFLGSLENSQLMRLSVFSDLVAFANVGTVGRGEFDSDQIELRLNNSVISTPGLVLKSDQAELFLRGQAYLNQRLDVDAALQTGNIVPDFGLGELTRSPLANLAVPGASIVTQSLDFLSNRVIYLHVGGTVRSPNFQLRTDRILQDALLRYYLPVSRYQQILRIR